MLSLRVPRSKFVTASAAAFATIGVVRAPAKAAQFEFKFASNQPLDHPVTVHQRKMWAAIEQESGGRIHTQLFPNSQLGGDSAMFSQLRLGAIDFLLQYGGTLASVVPGANIAFLGFAFKDSEEAKRVMDGPLGVAIRQDAGTKGMYAFRTVWDNGMSNIGSSLRPIRTPDDFHGFKIRVPQGNIVSDLFKGLGADPVSISVNEVYTALQTKIVDGIAAGLDSFETARWYEVQKYVSVTNHTWSGYWLIANGDKWKSLPSDLQDIIERNNRRWAQIEQRQTRPAFPALLAKLRSQGIAVNICDPVPFRQKLVPYYQSWAQTFGPAQWSVLENSVGHKLI